MADLHFAQPERRNVALPILLALAILAGAVYFVLRLTPHTTADITVTHVDLFPAHTVFKSETIVVGSDQAQDDLYLLVTLRITDHLQLPLFIKDITATLIPSDGSLPPATSAVELTQLPNLYTSFPALGKLAAAQKTPPLLRETRIDPRQTAEGYVVLHFPTTPAVWASRNDAVVTLALYHQDPLSISIPKQPAGATGTAPK